MALALLLTAHAWADKVVLRIRAGNPISTTQSVYIKSNLPLGVGTNDIIDLDGMEIGYDIKSDLYYVYKELELGPNKGAVFNVQINDVWAVPQDDLKQLEAHAQQLVVKLAGTDYEATAKDYLSEIATNLAAVVARQQASGIVPGVIKPMPHIRAYEANLEVLKRIKTDLGYLENLVLGTGQDIGDLLGTVKEAPLPEGGEVPLTGEYKSVVLTITVQNTSPKEGRVVPIEKNLPEEIKLQDVLGAGELDVAIRPESGLCYVFKKDVEIAPGETKVFEVTMRDKWNLGDLRVPELRKRAEALVERLGADGSFAAVEAALRGMLQELDEVEGAIGPELFNDRYVAFYRRQGEQLDRIEQKILRVESALRPQSKNTKLGFKAKPPSMKTTWLIIYIILGFLAIMSLLFFLRWYGGKK